MDAAAGALIMEGAKLALQIYFTNLKLAGKTEAEIQIMFQTEKALFDKNKPGNLLDV